ncbi:hypothetical protein [Sediminibacterium soli]|uniref:hypothetical protein n=1 Tax=Sediminibacterium soli TaxID=2698829 RepID=UPI001379AD5D|nr:hypothetical protein [Sediminibacterium soli]NCI45274.1 hypothetical protein [Sediminibacterium soli]
MNTIIKAVKMLLGFLVVACCMLFSCNKSVVGVSSIEKTELQTWLRENGLNFSSGTLYVKNNSGGQDEKKIDWDRISSFKSGAFHFFDVPYSSSQESSADFFLVFQKNEYGQIEARIKIVFKRDPSVPISKGDTYYAASFFDRLDGSREANFIWKDVSAKMPIRVYRKPQTAYSVLSQNSRKQFYVPDDCASYLIPNREYICRFVGISESQSYNMECGYETIGYTTFTVCLPQSGGGGGVSSETFYYPGYYHSGTNGLTNLPNKRIIDSLDGYPCAQNAMANSIFNYNGICDEIYSLLMGTFNVSSSVDLIYKVDNSLTMSDLLNGYADSIHFLNDPFTYSERVYLNPWVLKNSSQEFTVSVLIHEGMHAVIDYWRKQQRYGYIDSVQFKNMFPIFWDYNRVRTGTELSQHSQMAEGYIGQFKHFLSGFNSNISDSMATALAWMGLQETTAWKARSDTNELKILQHIARRDNSDSTRYSTYLLKKCP